MTPTSVSARETSRRRDLRHLDERVAELSDTRNASARPARPSRLRRRAWHAIIGLLTIASLTLPAGAGAATPAPAALLHRAAAQMRANYARQQGKDPHGLRFVCSGTTAKITCSATLGRVACGALIRPMKVRQVFVVHGPKLSANAPIEEVSCAKPGTA